MTALSVAMGTALSVARSIGAGVGGEVILPPFEEFQATLEAAGIWTKIDAIYALGRPTSTDAFVNLRNPGTGDLVPVGTAPVFTAGKGYRSAASGSYLRSINTSAETGNFKRDDHSFGLWCMDDVESNFAGMGWGNYLMNPKTATNTARYRSSSTTADSVSGETDGRGLCAISRDNSATFKFYRNGELRADETRTSIAQTSGDWRICSWGDGSSNHYDQTRSHSFAFIGGSLTASQMLVMYQAAGRLLTRINA